MVKLYWIRLPKHTDIYTEGYVGITNDFEYRMNQYKGIQNTKSKQHYRITKAIIKYGWDSLVKEVLFTFNSYEEALIKEHEFRPTACTGWNTMVGGGNGGKHSEEVKKRISKAMKGNQNTSGFSSETVACPYCKKKGQEAAMQRWHFQNCKYR